MGTPSTVSSGYRSNCGESESTDQLMRLIGHSDTTIVRPSKDKRANEPLRRRYRPSRRGKRSRASSERFCGRSWSLPTEERRWPPACGIPPTSAGTPGSASPGGSPHKAASSAPCQRRCHHNTHAQSLSVCVVVLVTKEEGDVSPFGLVVGSSKQGARGVGLVGAGELHPAHGVVQHVGHCIK
jgi:hypothetical protein